MWLGRASACGTSLSRRSSRKAAGWFCRRRFCAEVKPDDASIEAKLTEAAPDETKRKRQPTGQHASRAGGGSALSEGGRRKPTQHPGHSFGRKAGTDISDTYDAPEEGWTTEQYSSTSVFPMLMGDRLYRNYIMGLSQREFAEQRDAGLRQRSLHTGSSRVNIQEIQTGPSNSLDRSGPSWKTSEAPPPLTRIVHEQTVFSDDVVDHGLAAQLTKDLKLAKPLKFNVTHRFSRAPRRGKVKFAPRNEYIDECLRNISHLQQEGVPQKVYIDIKLDIASDYLIQIQRLVSQIQDLMPPTEHESPDQPGRIIQQIGNAIHGLKTTEFHISIAAGENLAMSKKVELEKDIEDKLRDLGSQEGYDAPLVLNFNGTSFLKNRSGGVQYGVMHLQNAGIGEGSLNDKLKKLQVTVENCITRAGADVIDMSTPGNVISVPYHMSFCENYSLEDVEDRITQHQKKLSGATTSPEEAMDYKKQLQTVILKTPADIVPTPVSKVRVSIGNDRKASKANTTGIAFIGTTARKSSVPLGRELQDIADSLGNTSQKRKHDFTAKPQSAKPQALAAEMTS